MWYMFFIAGIGAFLAFMTMLTVSIRMCVKSDQSVGGDYSARYSAASKI